METSLITAKEIFHHRDAVEGSGALLWKCDLPCSISNQVVLDSSFHSVQIHTSAGVSAILSHITTNVPHYAFSLRTWGAIARATENKLILIFIQSNESLNGHTHSCFGIIHIYLNVPWVYEVCSTAALEGNMPLRVIRYNDQTKLTESGAGGKSPRFYALLLLEAMAEIFQDSLIRDVADTIFQRIPSDRNADSLKHAHEIYKVIDNMHIDEVLLCSPADADNPSEPMQQLQIKGLLPTLRPYQEAAVRWMVQREQMDAESSYRNSNEWELAWVVISSHDDTADSQSTHPKPLTFVTPLYKWMNDTNTNKNTGILFYCPFGGWLARSYKEAKDCTLNNSDSSISRKHVSGGILAESMGLGKYVSKMIALNFYDYFFYLYTASIYLSYQDCRGRLKNCSYSQHVCSCVSNSAM